MESIAIHTGAHAINASLFPAADAASVLIIAPATGVKQTFYAKFATYLSTRGITVVTFDYSGIGRSLNGNIKDVHSNAYSWGSVDLEKVLQYVGQNYPNTKKNLLGHSIGGQLIGFAKSATKMDKILLVAAQSGYWRFWKGMARIQMWYYSHLLFPVLVRLFGYLPSKSLSSMENLPKNMAKQWSAWCRDPEYLFGTIPPAKTYYSKIRSSLCALSIANDPYAPKAAVDWLTDKYIAANTKKIHLSPQDFNLEKIGHFGVFQEKFKMDSWPLLLRELG